MTERQKLAAAVDEFANAMKARLEEKRKDGFHGWDSSPMDNQYLASRILEKAARVFTHRLGPLARRVDLVDVANLAMMLWRKVREVPK